MSRLRPNGNASFSTERMFGFGSGLVVAALFLASSADDDRVLGVVLLGAAVVLVSMIWSIFIRRQQLAKDSLDNLKSLKTK